MTKLLLVTNDFPPRAGGIQQYCHNLVSRLPPERVVVYAPAWPGAAEFDAEQAFRVVRHPGRTMLPVPGVLRPVVALAREVRPDVIVFGAASVLMFAETKIENTSVFAAQAAAVPGTIAEQEAIRSRAEHTEVFPLALFAILGMMLFPASNDLIMMFVALEILSLPLYLLCGLARRRRLLSQEAALKYFLLGALSSAFFIYGAALLYGYSGSFTLSAIDDAIRNGTQGLGLLLAGMALLGVGLLFKFGAVPFHSWTPDVYAGAPTAVTGFMAACTKIAAVGALMRVFYVGLGADRWDWQPLMAIVTVATMVVGSVLAITQTDVKRMLAYSSIAHAGFMMVAFVGASQAVTGSRSGGLTSISSVMFYLVAYGAATIGAFALVTMVRDPTGEANLLNSWVGLGRRAPLAATITP